MLKRANGGLRGKEVAGTAHTISMKNGARELACGQRRIRHGAGNQYQIDACGEACGATKYQTRRMQSVSRSKRARRIAGKEVAGTTQAMSINSEACDGGCGQSSIRHGARKQ